MKKYLLIKEIIAAICIFIMFLIMFLAMIDAIPEPKTHMDMIK